MTCFLLTLSSSAIVAVVAATAGYRVGKREAVRDDLRFITSPTVEHSPEDAIRRAGC